MTDVTKEKVLFVDDEPHLLSAIRRNLRKSFAIETAESGAEGLEKLRQKGPFAVVVSDMQMPEMDGSEFLSKVKNSAPDCVRIMLTGDAGQSTAVAAINKGDVFKFLSKPCDTKDLESCVKDGIKAFQRTQIEQHMLEQTVQGSINLVTETLGLARPDVFGRATQLAALCDEIAKGFEMRSTWKLRTACLLSQIACIEMPQIILNKITAREELSLDENREYCEFLSRSADLVAKIPHLESVGEIIRHQLRYSDGSGFPEGVSGPPPIESSVIRLALDLDCWMAHYGGLKICELLADRRDQYEAVVYESALFYLQGLEELDVRQLTVGELTDSMMLADDVLDKNGVLLVCAGWPTHENVRKHLQKSVASGIMEDSVTVRIVED